MSVPHVYTEEDIDYWRDKAIEREAELDRLRAEIAKLREPTNRYWEGRWRDEEKDNDRLRAENARLMDALQMVVSSGYDEASRVFAAEVATGTILAKTVKS